MSRRGDATREHLLDVAERLYGERGITAVSLREIRLAAGSRNTAAMQFHFGDRDGLLNALVARHMPRIAERQQTLYDQLVSGRQRRTRRRLVEVLVRPIAEYATGNQQQRAWVRIMADLASLPELHLKEMVSFTPEAGLRAGAELFEQLRRNMPTAYARERLIVLAQSSIQTAADYARLRDNPSESRRHLNANAFIENLIDMRTAAVFAPVSEAAQAAMRR